MKLRNTASKKRGITQQNQGLAPYVGLLVSFHHTIPDHLVNGWVLRSCLLNPQFLCVAGKWGLWTVNQPTVIAFVLVVQASVWVIVVMAVRFGLLKEALQRSVHLFFIILAVSEILLFKVGQTFTF